MENDAELEALGEKLYDLIHPKYAEVTPKLTGMLLELPASLLFQMLTDESLLNQALERALAALTASEHRDATSQTDDVISSSSDSLGMLLEQKKEAVLQLLSDHSLLEERVQIAWKTLQEQREEATDVSDTSDREEDSVGETLYKRVHELEPAHCADITGMLLEMDSGSLQQILSDQHLLEAAVQRAKSALV
ncbi:hypothetical protein DNTS_004689 [Danionella cerebrum]|uniref:PABC domain-containing protein n=1 Tax=Danionella cerebrum TaxID=2873325 RepID=A0A553QZ17_9TELE|nr:hypothetical protein DNTS_004689 [Danionella translucida]